ncbi:MAG: hypothetical protein IJY39_12525 [Clostridia bacterium]|nr:hypothetical protein [Clostridia bacterium]
MKTAAKVFIIIGMIVGFWYILPLIFGAIALKKMKTEKPSVGFSVCVLIFCSVLGGIFLLCSKDEEYAPKAPEAPAEAPAETPAE